MIQEFLQTTPLFRDLDDEELAHVLLVARLRHFPEGARIVSEGECGRELHIIHTGGVRISKVIPGFGEEALVILSPGDFFGEIEFLDGEPASAHAIAHVDSEILSIPHAEVQALIASRPKLGRTLLWTMARVVASRLREMNRRIAGIFSLSRAEDR